jgi:DNA-binding NarL/FixJ family response regulator
MHEVTVTKAPGPRTRILIADDHDAVRRGVRELLREHASFEVVAEAADGLSALREARSTRPHVAIIDFSLPRMNGLDLTIGLRREVPGIEVLVYTMHDREDVMTEVLQAGARGYVLKSDDQENLLAAIDELVAHRPYFSPCVAELLLGHFLQSDPNLVGSILSERERDVVRLVADGKHNREVAHLLGLSIKSVEMLRHSAMEKLRLNSTADRVRYAVRERLVEG